MQRRGLLSAFLLIVSSGLALAQPVPAGPEFRVNTYTGFSQDTASVAVDGSGNFVVVWNSYRQDGSRDGVFARRYNSAGATLGAEFQVNTYTTERQFSPALAVDGSGNFVVVWESSGQDGSLFGIFGQRYNNLGAPQGGEFQINTYTTSFQTVPSVAVDGSGNFVVVWNSYGQDGSGFGIFGQRFTSAGAAAGGEFQVNTYTTGDQIVPAVAMDGSGDFVVVWSSDDQDGSGRGVFGQRFDNAGALVGGEFQVNTYTTSDQTFPTVALDSSSNFVVAWDSDGQDGSATGIFGQRFDNNGATVGGEFQINTYTTSDQFDPSLAIDGSGDSVVVWSSDAQDGSAAGILGQVFDSSGAPVGAEFQVNTYTTSYQVQPSVAADGSGNFEVVWQSNGQDGSFVGVFGRRFGSSIGCSDVDADGLCDNEDIVVTSPIEGGMVDCSDPALIRPTITWSAGNYDKFRVLIGSNSSFTTGTVVTSGSGFFSSTTYTPPVKKWKGACKKALAANPLTPELFFKIQGTDTHVPKSDPNRKTYSQVVRADVTP